MYIPLITTKSLETVHVSHGMFAALQDWKAAAIKLECRLIDSARSAGPALKPAEICTLATYRVLLSHYGIDTRTLAQLYYEVYSA